MLKQRKNFLLPFLIIFLVMAGNPAENNRLALPVSGLLGHQLNGAMTSLTPGGELRCQVST